VAGISLFHKYFYTVTPFNLKQISRGEKSRLGLCSTEVGAQTFLLGKKRISPSPPSRFISPRFCSAVWRGPLCFNSVTKAVVYNFFPPPRSVLPLETLLCEQRLPPALRTGTGDICRIDLFTTLRAIKKKHHQNPMVPTERKFSRAKLRGVVVTATLSFLDTMFLLTPENFPLECAINQQRRRQQLWRRRRSSEKGHSLFHLSEEGERGEQSRARGSARRGAAGQAGPPAPPGMAPQGCECRRPARRGSQLPASPWKTM